MTYGQGSQPSKISNREILRKSYDSVVYSTIFNVKTKDFGVNFLDLKSCELRALHYGVSKNRNFALCNAEIRKLIHVTINHVNRIDNTMRLQRLNLEMHVYVAVRIQFKLNH